MDTRMAFGRANRISDPRLLAALPDPRVTRIQAAYRACKPGTGERRENVMYGRTVYPRAYVESLDALRGTNDPAKLIAIGDAFRDAAYVTALGHSAADDLGDRLADDKAIEGEINQLIATLHHNPKSIGQLRRIAELLGRERDATEIARLATIQRIAGLEARQQ